MAGSQVKISALPASAAVASADIIPFVRSGVTDYATAGNFRTQIFAFAAADPLNCGVLTATGDSTITGKLSGITTLTATTGTFTTLSTSGAATFGAAVTVSAGGVLVTGSSSITASTNATLTLNTTSGATSDSTYLLFQRGGVSKWRVGSNVNGGNADLFEIYSDTGTISPFTISNSTRLTSIVAGLNLTGVLTFATAVSQVVPGATSLSFRNNANNADNFIITDAGNATLRGTLSFAPAASWIIPGATSFSIRDTGNAHDNLLLSNAGDATLAFGGLTLGSGKTLKIGSSQVLQGAISGWVAPTGTSSTATFVSDSVTLPNLAARVCALINNLMAHGLITT